MKHVLAGKPSSFGRQTITPSSTAELGASTSKGSSKGWRTLKNVRLAARLLARRNVNYDHARNAYQIPFSNPPSRIVSSFTVEKAPGSDELSLWSDELPLWSDELFSGLEWYTDLPEYTIDHVSGYLPDSTNGDVTEQRSAQDGDPSDSVEGSCLEPNGAENCFTVDRDPENGCLWLRPNSEVQSEQLETFHSAWQLIFSTHDQDQEGGKRKKAPDGVRTSSHRRLPDFVTFELTSIGTCSYQLFDSVKKEFLIQIDTLRQFCPTSLSSEGGVEVGELEAECFKVRSYRNFGELNPGSNGPEDPEEWKKHTFCQFCFHLKADKQKITIKVFRNGKTQANGCKSEKQVDQSHRLLCQLILKADESARSVQTQVVNLDQLTLQRIASEAPTKGKLSANGTFTVDFQDVGRRLNPSKLCDFLLQYHSDLFEAAVVGNDKPGGGGGGKKETNRADRLNQVNVMVRRSCIRSCQEQTEPGRAKRKQPKAILVHVNETGKCGVMNVPSFRAGQELASVVAEVCSLSHSLTLSLSHSSTSSRVRKRRRGWRRR